MNLFKNFKAGPFIPQILIVLQNKKNYGFPIIKKIRRNSDEEIEFPDGLFYPIFHKLERKGDIASNWIIDKNGKKRKYYKISKRGIKNLNNFLKNDNNNLEKYNSELKCFLLIN